ncbi:hypothetical protein HN682_01485 [Candidatus Peregrinibacteria bacterium]|nr:hypothetical protein [Candidatus Peregrinibacteria bacterium]
MIISPFVSAIASIIKLVCLQIAHAEFVIDPGSAINQVGGNLNPTLVGGNIGKVLSGSFSQYLPLANLIAVIIIIGTGLFLVTAQDENQIPKARNTLIALIFAIISMNLAEAFAGGVVIGLFGATGAQQGASIISREIIGLINFLEVPIVAIAIIMILLSGIRAMLMFGTDQGNADMRRTVIAVLSGILIISAKMVLATAIGANEHDVLIQGSPDSEPLVLLIADALKIILSFMALAAVVVIVIAGIMLVANRGDQDVMDKSRNMIARTIIGLIIILVSSGLVSVVLI